MKIALIAVACLLTLASATAQEKQASTKSTSAALEAHVQKLWADFKAKNKQALAAELSENFREIEAGGSGFGDKKAELAMMDEFELKSYTLKDFTVISFREHTALVTYLAHYEGTDAGETVKLDSAFGEVWTREGDEWKALYIQETKIK